MAALRLRLLDHVFEVEVIGEGFTGNSEVNIFYGFESVGGNGVQLNTWGERSTSTDQNGHFDGIIFSLPGRDFNIQARAVDVATGRDVTSAVLRPQV